MSSDLLSLEFLNTLTSRHTHHLDIAVQPPPVVAQHKSMNPPLVLTARLGAAVKARETWVTVKLLEYNGDEANEHLLEGVKEDTATLLIGRNNEPVWYFVFDDFRVRECAVYRFQATLWYKTGTGSGVVPTSLAQACSHIVIVTSGPVPYHSPSMTPITIFIKSIFSMTVCSRCDRWL